MQPEESLSKAWRSQVPPAPLVHDIESRVIRQRRARLLQRSSEIAFTVAAVAVFGGAAAAQGMQPAHWLLLPFFVIYLPAAWFVVLRGWRARSESLGENVSNYARQRLAQLRTGLRDLWLARRSATALLLYAGAALLLTSILGDQAWQTAALLMLGYSAAWWFGTRWFVNRRRRRKLREYRALRRLLAD